MTYRVPMALVALCLLAVAVQEARRPTRAGPSSPVRPAAPAGAAEAPHAVAAAGHSTEGPIRLVAVGGGTLPSSTEVSLEQDLALAVQVLPGPGHALFAGGPEALSVRELVPVDGPMPLRLRLGELFAPHGARGSRFRRPRIALAGPATRSRLEHALAAALSGPDNAPLVLYIATHGQQGESPADNHVLLWAGGTLDARTLARLHDGARRPLRAVMTSCYSGGFAELAFAGGDPEQGPATSPRCGLFAGTWDRTTSGCDPNPDRRAQESYAVHFLSALRGQDRAGRPLSMAQLDYNGDGVVGLLDAHSRATAHAVTIDVPTTTSERYLRHVEPASPPGVAERARDPAGALPELRETQRILRELGGRLGLSNVESAETEFARLGQAFDRTEADLLDAERAADASYHRLAARLLGRFPALADAYRGDFEATLDQHRPAIVSILDDSPQSRSYRRDQARLLALDEAFFALQVREAQVVRYLRAHETRTLATRLARRGGPEWAHYRALLHCERAAP